jgi:hypothetical protein
VAWRRWRRRNEPAVTQADVDHVVSVRKRVDAVARSAERTNRKIDTMGDLLAETLRKSLEGR